MFCFPTPFSDWEPPLKLPFAVNESSGQVVEVGEVPSGRACGCVCISCGAGVVARKGDVNAWHFAHDPHAVHRPDIECDMSFESACRLFAIDFLKAGHAKEIVTPARYSWDKGHFTQSIKPTKLLGLKFVSSEEYGDVSAEVGGFVLEVFFGYSGRVRPPLPKDRARTGVLEIFVGELASLYFSRQAQKGLLADILKKVFSEETGPKAWLYHPKDLREPPSDVLARGRSRAGRAGSNQRSGRFDYIFDKPLASSSGEPDMNQQGTFTCQGCGAVWRGRKNRDMVCSRCASHLLSRFDPD